MSPATWDERRLDVDLLLEFMDMHKLMQCFHVNNTRAMDVDATRRLKRKP